MPFQPGTFSCDGCGKPREKTNHWWVVTRRQKKNTDGSVDIFLELRPMKAEETPGSNGSKGFYCGQACTSKAVSAFMSAQFEAPIAERAPEPEPLPLPAESEVNQ